MRQESIFKPKEFVNLFYTYPEAETFIIDTIEKKVDSDDVDPEYSIDKVWKKD